MTLFADPAPGPPIAECARAVLKRGGVRPEVHIVLGSGLGGVAERMEDAVAVPFGDLPGFPEASVSGHEGCFLIGRIEGTPVLLQSGRFHFYEGFGAEIVAAPVRVGRALGAGTLFLTNASGGIRSDLAPGALMLVDDHINLGFQAPLAGPLHPGEERFPDMSRPYDGELMAFAEEVALAAGIRLTRGVYGWVGGPNFETPAEVLALRAAGADVVGMSTVPEAIVARAGGQRVLAISVVTNRAAGLGLEVVDHEEVMAWGAVAGEKVAVLLEELVPLLAAG
ncbi:MAG: purine-nucleoside phosphorylase [Gemmatimonadota bacterium]|nr:purine-nucleoside phosphorylase [Gemmatimonadota bacterium]MDE2676679.1 purine-nucleoside phosphorylase [Gemmatimonadota bacterium]